MPAKPNKLIIVSSYPPRDCGIATFTQDLVRAISDDGSGFQVEVVPINEPSNQTRIYPEFVKQTIDEEEREGYVRAAHYINESDATAVSIQHEYGIYGGDCGEYVLELTKRIRKPVVVTLHTILSVPSPKQKQVLQKIALECSLLIVMAKTAVDILTSIYHIAPEKIVVIPHGVPETEFIDQKAAKQTLGFSDKLVISTFGLIGAGKGLEYVIDSLPLIKKRFPNITYLILGKSHPNAVAVGGESYRQSLAKRIADLGLDEQVKFDNRFLPKQDLITYLQATDIYITPYLDPQQITSGTLAYAFSMGRACVSTPYIYANELLDGEGGRLVPFRDAGAIAKAIIDLLQNEKQRKLIEQRNYTVSRPMTWKNVSARYAALFRSFVFPDDIGNKKEFRSRPDLSHLRAMTTSLGLLQHAKGSEPDPAHGYSIDDNARALVAAYQYYEIYKEPSAIFLARKYFDNIKRSKIAGSYFHNFSDKKGRFTDEIGSETSSCRAIWALGYVASRANIAPSIAREARRLLADLPPITKLRWIRSKAYALLGYYYLKDKNKVRYLADQLVSAYKSNAKYEWFEPLLTYANAIFPLSLMLAFALTGRREYLAVGQRSFRYLDRITRPAAYPAPISHLGWEFAKTRNAAFDQQVIEASDMVMAAEAAKIVTADKYFDRASHDWMEWFYGRNQNQIALVDSTTGAVFDGLTLEGVNLNQGAESIACYLLAFFAANSPATVFATTTPKLAEEKSATATLRPKNYI